MRVVLDEGAYMPEYAHADDAGADLRSPVDANIWSEGSIVIDTGVHVEIPKGYVGFLKSKSGLNINGGLVSEGVIDSGFTGSIRVKLYNHGDDMRHIKRGDKITQLVILPFVHADFEVTESLENTERGDKGFGSTGR